VLPLALLWLAAHAFLLAVILSLKVLGTKALALVLLLGAAFWFLIGRRRPALLLPPEMV
jgi:hypothetical protein